MYNVSSAFHQAVANGNHQIAMLIFDDAVFTNDDINVNNGIEFKDCFNMDENLSIGQALSNEITFSIFNDKRLLNDYEFGDFTATIGVQIGQETVTVSGTVRVDSANHSYVAHSTSPYLTRDGSAVSSQPVSKIISMLVYNGTVYCGLANGLVIGYKDSNGSSQSVNANNYMKNKFADWAGKGIYYNPSSRILTEWIGTKKLTYEFAPLGVFTAERPNVPDVNEIQMVCNDLMMKFDKDFPGSQELSIAYPSTIGNLFIRLCNYVGVSYVTSSFINSTATVDSEPEEFENATMREILQWIAEAAGSNARINRDGKVILDWIRSTNQTINENGYAEFSPYWYETKKVTKLHNRASNGEYETSTGSGDEAYLIQDNPLLKGVE